MFGEHTSSTQTRRAFLKTAASSAAIASSVNVVSGKSEGAKEAGIIEAYRNLMKNGKKKRAIDLMRDSGIDYDHKRMIISKDGQRSVVLSNPNPSEIGNRTGDGGSEVGTDRLFSQEHSTFDFLGYPTSKPLYNVELWWDLAPVASGSCPDPHDAAAITFQGARWEVEGDSETTSKYCKKFDSRKDGVKVEWDDAAAWGNEGKSDGHMWATIEKSSPYRGNAQNVWAHYSHTWTPTYKAGCLGAILGKSVSLSPGLISVDTAANKWKVETNNSPIEI